MEFYCFGDEECHFILRGTWNCLRRSVDMPETTSLDWNLKRPQLLNYRISATECDPIHRGSLPTNFPCSVETLDAV